MRVIFSHLMVSHRVNQEPHNNFLVALRRFYCGAGCFGE